MHTRIAIIGSGFAGLGAAIRLKRDGIDDFLVFERASDVGGTWRDNTYPGCACDVESHLYSLSFALEPGWTRRFSRQPEIWAYLQRCAREFGILFTCFSGRPHGCCPVLTGAYPHRTSVCTDVCRSCSVPPGWRSISSGNPSS
jgi:cation diffusion facilitator CzcD-associated flavoprotein CzcO